MKKLIWKRVFAVLLAVCMAAVLLPHALPAARAAEDHVHEDDPDAEWIPLSVETKTGIYGNPLEVLMAGETEIADNSLPAGNYYLASDVDLTNSSAPSGDTLNIWNSGKTQLCLNGHTLTGEISVLKESDLTIYDCKGGGIVTYSDLGGTVYISRDSTVRLVSGTLENSLTGTGGSVVDIQATGSFEMIGGTVYAPTVPAVLNYGTTVISGGTVSTTAYAIRHRGGTLTLSGSPVISGTGTKASDISLDEGMVITLENFTGAPEKPYSVTTETTGVCQFADDAASKDIDSFLPATPGYMVELREDSQLWFTEHVHNFDEESWTYDETQHWHACLGAGVCDGEEKTDHTVGEWLDDVEADQHYKMCAVCGAEVQRALHDWKAGVPADGTRVDTCKTCGATRTVTLYSVSGKVVTENGTPVSGANVKLVQGRREIASVTTDANGAYSFPNVDPGVYDVVATDDDKTVTILVTVSGSDLLNQDLVMPQGDVSSKLNVVNDSTVSDPVPDVVVGGLDREAIEQAENSASVTVTMDVTYYGTSPGDTLGNTEQIHAEVYEAGVTLEYFQIDVKKVVTTSSGSPSEDDITQTKRVLTIVIPYSLGGRTNVAVHRYHDSEVQALKKLSSKPSALEDGTFWADAEHNLVYIYADKFSTYSISSTNGNDVPEKNPEPLPEPGDSGASQPPLSLLYPVEIRESANGGVSVRHDRVLPGTKVTLTVSPKEGYEALPPTVTDSRGRSVEVTRAGSGTYTFVMPFSAVTVEGQFTCVRGELCPMLPFKDTDMTAWYHDGVHFCVERDLMVGVAPDAFSPNTGTTRAMLVSVLYRLDGEPAVTGSSGFADVPAGLWYSDAVTWAAANKIVMGCTDTVFAPDDPLTREQLAAFLYRYAAYKGYDVTGRADLAVFADASSVSTWAADNVAWAVRQGLIAGLDPATLAPTNGATRAMTAAILQRFCDKYEK